MDSIVLFYAFDCIQLLASLFIFPKLCTCQASRTPEQTVNCVQRLIMGEPEEIVQAEWHRAALSPESNQGAGTVYPDTPGCY